MTVQSKKKPSGKSKAANTIDRDYVSVGYILPKLAHAFPHRVIGDKMNHPWVYLRREVPHFWHVDERNPLMGFLSVDEASILHTLGLVIPDAEALEIGCHRGWSTAHLASAVKSLDVIDPVLANETHLADVQSVLASAGVLDKTTLYPGQSPGLILELAAKRSKPWSMIFIDGDHEPDGPLWDAQTVANCAAKDAIVVFHDLASPVVSEGLAYLRSLGWSCLVFQTMQIMGVAYRGNVTIPTHTPDPAVNWKLPDHLRTFRVSGETEAEYCARLERFFVDFSSADRNARATAVIPMGTPTAGALPKDIRTLQSELTEAKSQMENLRAEATTKQTAIHEILEKLTELQLTIEFLRMEAKLSEQKDGTIEKLEIEIQMRAQTIARLESELSELKMTYASVESEFKSRRASVKHLISGKRNS